MCVGLGVGVGETDKKRSKQEEIPAYGNSHVEN